MGFGLVGIRTCTETNAADCAKGDFTYTAYEDANGHEAGDCKTAGEVIISFATFGLVAVIVLILFVLKRKNSGGGGFVKLMTAAAAGFGTFCALTCWSTWVGECHNHCQDQAVNLGGEKKDAQLHAGFAMAMLSTGFMGIACINELCISDELIYTAGQSKDVPGSTNPNEAGPAAIPMTTTAVIV